MPGREALMATIREAQTGEARDAVMAIAEAEMDKDFDKELVDTMLGVVGFMAASIADKLDAPPKTFIAMLRLHADAMEKGWDALMKAEEEKGKVITP